MDAAVIARRFAEIGAVEDAQKAYALALTGDLAPEQALEACVYLLQTGYDHRVPYTGMVRLYNAGQLREAVLPILTEAFYLPNVELLQQRYRRNCRALAKYPYLFRQDFPAFEELPLRFYPFDDDGYLPFDTEAGQFGEYVNPNHQEITHYFFKDLENPILATDIFSQYELEYLNDNVRKSEWCARENHIYLHYTSWPAFCAWLCVLDWRGLIKDQKFVFLIEEEKALYPIDFKERFGIDYSQYTVKPFGVREVNKLIWHTQLASHNGGDFFNEIMYGHPNLLTDTSRTLKSFYNELDILAENLRLVRVGRVSLDEAAKYQKMDPKLLRALVRLHDPTPKDHLVALILDSCDKEGYLDYSARIAPALFLQPHFEALVYSVYKNEAGYAVLDSEQFRELQQSPLLKSFKYIKTFTPMRRPTTSYAATVKFMYEGLDEVSPDEENKTIDERAYNVIDDELTTRTLNRSFMIDWQDRLFKDSRLVRFEDGKLNPTATFTALAEFLDIPYTESMTYCSGRTGRDPESLAGNARGFDTSRLYATYDEWANDAERAWLEFFLRDAYEAYGYDFMYYDGAPVDEARAKEMLKGFTTLDGFIAESYRRAVRKRIEDDPQKREEYTAEQREKMGEDKGEQMVAMYTLNRHKIAGILLDGLKFVNRSGQPLRLMTPLKLDPALLQQPLYH